MSNKKVVKVWRLKSWVETTLHGIAFTCFFMLGAECETIRELILSHLVIVGIMILAEGLVMAYGRKND